MPPTLVEAEFHILRGMLISYLCERGLHLTRAQDVADDVLTRCWQQETNGRKINRSYVLVSARNALYDWVLKASNRCEVELEQAASLGYQDRLSGGSGDVTSGLGKTDRTITVLRAAGYRNRDIAEALGGSTAWVKSRRHRTAKKLRGTSA